MASAYLIELKGLGMLNNIKTVKLHGFSETADNCIFLKDLTLYITYLLQNGIS